jgi:PEGA domain-containing protein
MKSVSRISAEVASQLDLSDIFPLDLRWYGSIVRLAVLFCLCLSHAAAQATAEYGHISASAKAATATAPSATTATTQSPTQTGASAVAAHPTEAGEAANRAALEAAAGKNAAKLMLRSAPGNAQVRVNGKRVGKTPLLLIVAPGVYAVEMEGGARMDFARRQVDLLPKETRELLLALEPRYPARIRLSGAPRHSGPPPQ